MNARTEAILIFAVPLSFALGACLGGWRVRRRSQEQRDHSRNLRHVADMLGTLGYLELVRAEKSEKATEYLEHSLDCSVCKVGYRLGELRKDEKKSAIACLELVRDYRVRWPRQVKPDGDHEQMRDALDAAGEASSILNGLAHHRSDLNAS